MTTSKRMTDMEALSALVNGLTIRKFFWPKKDRMFAKWDDSGKVFVIYAKGSRKFEALWNIDGALQGLIQRLRPNDGWELQNGQYKRISGDWELYDVRSE